MNTNQTHSRPAVRRLFVPVLSIPDLFARKLCARILRARNPAGNPLRILGTVLLLLFTWTRAFAAQVDVNTADMAALADALTGVGPKIAAAIVEYREANGPYTAAEDLLNVKGIGPVLLEKNRSDILIGADGPTSAGADGPDSGAD